MDWMSSLDPLSVVVGATALLILTLPLFVVALRQARAAGERARDAEIIVLGKDLEAARRDIERLEAAVDDRDDRERESQRMLRQLRDQFLQVQTRLERMRSTELELQQLRQTEQDLRAELAAARERGQELATRLEETRHQSVEKLALLEDVRGQMTLSFQHLAAEILEDKSRRFTEQNSLNLQTLLMPLREQIGAFQKVVGDVYEKESRERSVLANEIQTLKSLNQQISTDAVNLTRALKGEAKVQGAWGELVLERLLEASGLTKGREFEVQNTFRDADGSRLRPDVIVHLPDRKDLVIDSKVSLTAYERYASAADEHERNQALDQHLLSVRRHVQSLGEKRYAELYGINSLDFVLLFIPVEAAFIEAVRRDDTLYDHALERNIVLTSPSTLLAVLRTVANLWRVEDRNNNALLIAQKAGALYDKFEGFVADLDRLGNALGTAQKHYDAAFLKLSQGRGNLVRRSEELRRLGARASRLLPQTLLDGSDEEDEGGEGPELPAPDHT